VRPAFSAAALIEQNDAVTLRVEEAPLFRAGAATWAAVQKDYRLAVRVTGLLEVERVPAAD
jgi:hypothetical protein